MMTRHFYRCACENSSTPRLHSILKGILRLRLCFGTLAQSSLRMTVVFVARGLPSIDFTQSPRLHVINKSSHGIDFRIRRLRRHAPHFGLGAFAGLQLAGISNVEAGGGAKLTSVTSKKGTGVACFLEMSKDFNISPVFGSTQSRK